MPIYAPGRRDRKGKVRTTGKRNVVATLSLTAMVDMFTVLTIFLLQNYNVTGQVIQIPKDVQLPSASAVKELAPATIVVITPNDILVNSERVISFVQVREQKDWMITPLSQKVVLALKDAQAKAEASWKAKVQEVVSSPKEPAQKDESWRRVTLQADREIDFLTVKKIMYTLTEAGAAEINFAVIRTEKPEGSAAVN